MIDRGEADDKIISVLDNDRYYHNVHDIKDLPEVLIERLTHYFSTYKLIPGKADNNVDRKSTRLNSSHVAISYAVFCLKKKTKDKTTEPTHQQRIYEQPMHTS